MRYGIVLAAALTMQGLQAQPTVRQLYDAGKFREVIAAADQARADPEFPRLEYLAGQSHAKLGEADLARQTYERLAAGDNPAWASIAKSAIALLDKQFDPALAAADEAVASGPDIPETHYQLGLVRMNRREYEPAAAAFDAAIALDPSFAQAHYYGGLAEYRAKRIDKMAGHFEAFLKLAPEAPERKEVESIMRTVRGG